MDILKILKGRAEPWQPPSVHPADVAAASMAPLAPLASPPPGTNEYAILAGEFMGLAQGLADAVMRCDYELAHFRAARIHTRIREMDHDEERR